MEKREKREREREEREREREKEREKERESAGTWRQQTSACSLVHCPLWTFRPLAQGVPACIAARDVSQLPNGWRSLSHDAAIALVAGKAGDSLYGWPVERDGGISRATGGARCQSQFKASKSGAGEQREGALV